MWIQIIITSYFLSKNCLGIYLIDLKVEKDDNFHSAEKEETTTEPQEATIQRRFMNQPYPPVRNDYGYYRFRQNENQPMGEDEKDLDIKNKIFTLVQQTVHDTERKIKAVDNVKAKHRDEAPYKIGFILSMIKKARDVLNELFNVAVKHRDEWKALEQLKIFELIVHTNVDTTNLVRQLVEIHVQYMNTTNDMARRKRVVLL